jgi:hypothetical protein
MNRQLPAMSRSTLLLEQPRRQENQSFVQRSKDYS